MWKRHACLVRSAIWSRSTSSGEPNDEDLPEQCSLQLLTCREKLKRPSSVWRRSGWKSRSLMMPSAIACACLPRFKEWKVSIVQIRFVADCLSSAGSHGLSKCCGDWKRCVIRRDRMLICECASMGLRLRLRCGRVAHDSSIIRCFKGTRFAMLSKSIVAIEPSKCENIASLTACEASNAIKECLAELAKLATQDY